MKKTEKLKILFHGRPVGVLSLTPDNRLNVFEYDKSWLATDSAFHRLNYR